MKDLQTQINELSAKLEASQGVHAAFIGLMLRMMPTYERQIFEAARKAISSQVAGGDQQAAENLKLLGEQYAFDAIDRIEKFVRELGG